MSLRSAVRRHGLLGLLLLWPAQRLWCLAWGHKAYWEPVWHWQCARCGANLGDSV